MTTNAITVTARKWAHGWELIIDENNATQVRTLAHAAQQVRDYLDTIDPETDHSQVNVLLTLDQEDVAAELAADRQARRAAEEDALERWAASDEPTIRDDAKIIRGSEESRAEIQALLMAADDG
ncbi:hypothetical protein [Nesterenkonia sp.]|uniref:hypothetical protein n=1 Tax=Nesterenkonia sp. TaxID=704201 RepID=UPI00262AD8F7|nr:hypothetical protein [Nesterenkonia sp.]